MMMLLLLKKEHDDDVDDDVDDETEDDRPITVNVTGSRLPPAWAVHPVPLVEH